MEEVYVLKVRIKFAKDGVMKFVGHLDIMRFFQKAIRRSGLDVAYSEGFSPHMILSFASPLGVGLTSEGEYLDLELKTGLPSDELVRRLDEQMCSGMKILSACQIEEGKMGKAMSLVAAADYIVYIKEFPKDGEAFRAKMKEFFAQEEIVVRKKTKTSEKDMDIKPYIYELFAKEETAKEGYVGEVHMLLSAGSAVNIKPELVMEAFDRFIGREAKPFSMLCHRKEMYALKKKKEVEATDCRMKTGSVRTPVLVENSVLVPLGKLGAPIE